MHGLLQSARSPTNLVPKAINWSVQKGWLIAVHSVENTRRDVATIVLECVRAKSPKPIAEFLDEADLNQAESVHLLVQNHRLFAKLALFLLPT